MQGVSPHARSVVMLLVPAAGSSHDSTYYVFGRCTSINNLCVYTSGTWHTWSPKAEGNGFWFNSLPESGRALSRICNTPE